MSVHTEQCTMGDRYSKYVGLYRLQLRPAYLCHKTPYGYPFDDVVWLCRRRTLDQSILD